MTYRRKPKDLTKFMSGIKAAHALHTWEYADDTRLKHIGSSAPSLSVEARKSRELNRRHVGAYRDSHVAAITLTKHGEVSKFTEQERAKRVSRLERAESDQKNLSSPRPSLIRPPERPIPNPSLYPRPNL